MLHFKNNKCRVIFPTYPIGVCVLLQASPFFRDDLERGDASPASADLASRGDAN
jgi:hypothetical protein